MYYVYILYSHSCGRRYTGQKDDLDRRLRQHNDLESTGSLAMKRFPGPRIMIHSESFPS